MGDSILYLLAIIALVLMSMGLFIVAITPYFCLYAKESILISASYLLFLPVISVLRTTHALPAEVVQLIGSLVTILFLVILIEIVYLHVVFHRKEKEING